MIQQNSIQLIMQVDLVLAMENEDFDKELLYTNLLFEYFANFDEEIQK